MEMDAKARGAVQETPRELFLEQTGRVDTGVTVIVVSFLESVVTHHSKDHPLAVAYVGSDTLTGDPYTTLLDATPI